MSIIDKLRLLERLKAENKDDFLSLQAQATAISETDYPLLVIFAMFDLLDRQENGFEVSSKCHKIFL